MISREIPDMALEILAIQIIDGSQNDNYL